MSRNLGPEVSYVYEDQGYNYDMVVFQKQKPPLDSELNLVQQLQDIINRRQSSGLPSGWLSYYPAYTDTSLENQFYTQDPTSPKPEYALVNGMVVHVTNTETTVDNLNIIDLGTPPSSGNRVNGVFLEVWRALLDPDTSTNKPNPETVIDSLYGLYMHDEDNGWISGQNGLILGTDNGGQTWEVQAVDTNDSLNDIYFINSTIGWVVGNNGTIARTTSAGQRWTLLTSVTTENLNSICAASQLIAWAVGDFGTILKTTNGITWVEKTVTTNVNLNSVHFYDSQVGWVAGNDGVILKTTDGGANWSSLLSGTTENLNAIHFYDLNFGFAVGDNGTILRTSDGGGSWVTQSNNVYINGSYTSVTENLNDVTMAPTLDELVTNEEVSSQLTGTNRDFVLSNTPITLGDGRGITTNDPNQITVTVNGSQVAVDSLNGITGAVLLGQAPNVNDTVLVTYYHRRECAVFNGRAWIVGDSGRVLYTEDIGATWEKQEIPGSQYNLNNVEFVDKDKGWLVGAFSIVRNTENGGTTWEEQQTETFIRQVQRVYNEGNVYSDVYLTDNAIHPDANVETTKRVQIQYRVRVVSGADPDSNPEAGLSSSVYGLGPNDEAEFPYESMGPISGDYGLWRAKCDNTVDGYCWAIPMYFVARRNTASYNASTNPNGAHQKDTNFIRPDLLTAEMVVDSDILDVRRRVIVPSVKELLDRTYDSLSNNTLKTVFGRRSDGGDRYGSEILQLDRIAGQSGDGGDAISGATIAEAAGGLISSEITPTEESVTVTASTTLPTQQILGPIDGLFLNNTALFKAVYDSSSPTYNGKTIPGYWTGLGTNTVTFVFNTNANTQNEDAGLTDYIISAKWIDPDVKSLKYIPYAPKLVKNISGLGSPAFYYQGVLDSTTSRTLETWSSQVAGYNNYTLAYPAQEYTDTSQTYRASNVELHYYVKVTSSNIIGTDTFKLTIPIQPDADDVAYNITTVSKINNITSGFSYKIDEVTYPSGEIYIKAATGFAFIVGQDLEVIAYVTSESGNSNVRNGSTVNFTQNLKSISKFTRSEVRSVAVTNGSTSASVVISNSEVLGMSTLETTQSLNSYICWFDVTSSLSSTSDVVTCTPSGFGTGTLSLTFDAVPSDGFILVQVLSRDTQLEYTDGSNNGLLIGYNYIPHQAVSSLPTTLTLEPVLDPDNIIVSNLGPTGGTEGYPYDVPLEHVPVNDIVLTDNFFVNNEPLRFNNISIDGGYARMPIYVPGSFGETITLSSADEDALFRAYYSAVSKEFVFSTEGLSLSVFRKVYMPVICRVKDTTNSIFMNGEYVIAIFSRSVATEKENRVGYQSGSGDSVSIYRIPNKPISRV